MKLELIDATAVEPGMWIESDHPGWFQVIDVRDWDIEHLEPVERYVLVEWAEPIVGHVGGRRSRQYPRGCKVLVGVPK